MLCPKGSKMSFLHDPFLIIIYTFVECNKEYWILETINVIFCAPINTFKRNNQVVCRCSERHCGTKKINVNFVLTTYASSVSSESSRSFKLLLSDSSPHSSAINCSMIGPLGLCIVPLPLPGPASWTVARHLVPAVFLRSNVCVWSADDVLGSVDTERIN